MLRWDCFYKSKELQDRKESVDFALARCCGSLLEAIEKSPAQTSGMKLGCYVVV